MKNALFVFHHSADSRASEFATLATIAGVLEKAGYASDLQVLDTTGSSAVVVKNGRAFRKVSALSPDKPVGDAADYLTHVVRKAVSGGDVSLVIGFGTIANRNWAPQIAASMSADFVTSCEMIEVTGGKFLVGSPVMGAMVQKIQSVGDRGAVLLYNGEALTGSGANDAEVQVTAESVDTGSVRFIGSQTLPDSGGIPLRGAAKVVSGGLGVGSGEKWRIIEDFAVRVDAAVGASRAAVEMGWVPSSRQVGFSGQKVSPDVYVAIGISGAVHHLAGIAGAKKIVAINKDPEAGIFKIADIGIVGDYEQILAAATRKL